MRRAALPLLGVWLQLLHCTSPTKCDPMTCATGCCDQSGACVSGSARAACGAGGTACTVCAPSEICRSHACAPAGTAGGAAGGVGGGSGGGGGSAGGAMSPFTCSATRTVAVFDGPVVDAGFKAFNWVDLAQPDPTTRIDGGWDELDLELYQGVQTFEPVPGVSDLDGGDEDGAPIDYRSCGVCPLYLESCSGSPGSSGVLSRCERTYLGVSGHVDVAQATQAVPGRVYATSASVTFVEWDFVNDRPAMNSRCVVVGAATHDAGWP